MIQNETPKIERLPSRHFLLTHAIAVLVMIVSSLCLMFFTILVGVSYNFFDTNWEFNDLVWQVYELLEDLSFSALIIFAMLLPLKWLKHNGRYAVDKGASPLRWLFFFLFAISLALNALNLFFVFDPYDTFEADWFLIKLFDAFVFLAVNQVFFGIVCFYMIMVATKITGHSKWNWIGLFAFIPCQLLFLLRVMFSVFNALELTDSIGPFWIMYDSVIVAGNAAMFIYSLLLLIRMNPMLQLYLNYSEAYSQLVLTAENKEEVGV